MFKQIIRSFIFLVGVSFSGLCMAHVVDNVMYTLQPNAQGESSISYTMDQWYMQSRYYNLIVCEVKVINGNVPIERNSAKMNVSAMNYSPADGKSVQVGVDYTTSEKNHYIFSQNVDVDKKNKEHSFVRFNFRGTPSNPNPMIMIRCFTDQ